eukprot:4779545-Ditylum_brightwellii.AAC.1
MKRPVGGGTKKRPEDGGTRPQDAFVSPRTVNVQEDSTGPNNNKTHLKFLKDKMHKHEYMDYDNMAEKVWALWAKMHHGNENKEKKDNREENKNKNNKNGHDEEDINDDDEVEGMQDNE